MVNFNLNDKRNDHALAWVEKVVAEATNTTTWEDEFIESIHDLLKRGRRLTVSQLDILERIYSEKTK